MRKHNVTFAQRMGRSGGDRSTFPQAMSHALVNSKEFHLASNGVLKALLKRVQ